jgi:2-polyprenyl-3-methyl-5-hydroxy-6-metoxy-1,4-benzoquinol methylase
MVDPRLRDFDVETVNDRLATEHSIDDYYARSPYPIRLVERRRLSIIREFVGPADGLDILEVGSGGGHVLEMFPTARLIANDVSGEYLSLARERLEGYDVRFLKGEIDQVDLPEQSVDRVICTEVLEHVVDPDAVLSASARLLRTSGVAVITVPNDPLIGRVKNGVLRSPLRWLLGDRIDWGGDVYHLHHWTPDEFEQVLARHFQVTHRRGAPVNAIPLRACFRCVRR